MANDSVTMACPIIRCLVEIFC